MEYSGTYHQGDEKQVDLASMVDAKIEKLAEKFSQMGGMLENLNSELDMMARLTARTNVQLLLLAGLRPSIPYGIMHAITIGSIPKSGNTVASPEHDPKLIEAVGKVITNNIPSTTTTKLPEEAIIEEALKPVGEHLKAPIHTPSGAHGESESKKENGEAFATPSWQTAPTPAKPRSSVPAFGEMPTYPKELEDVINFMSSIPELEAKLKTISSIHLTDKLDKGQLGKYLDDQTVLLRKGMPFEEQVKTLSHEGEHGVLFESGIDIPYVHESKAYKAGLIAEKMAQDYQSGSNILSYNEYESGLTQQDYINIDKKANQSLTHVGEGTYKRVAEAVKDSAYISSTISECPHGFDDNSVCPICSPKTSSFASHPAWHDSATPPLSPTQEKFQDWIKRTNPTSTGADLYREYQQVVSNSAGSSIPIPPIAPSTGSPLDDDADNNKKASEDQLKAAKINDKSSKINESTAKKSWWKFGGFPHKIGVDKYGNDVHAQHPWVKMGEWTQQHLSTGLLAASAATAGLARAGSPIAFDTVISSFELLLSKVGGSMMKPMAELAKRLQDASRWYDRQDDDVKDTIGKGAFNLVALGVGGLLLGKVGSFIARGAEGAASLATRLSLLGGASAYSTSAMAVGLAPFLGGMAGIKTFRHVGRMAGVEEGSTGDAAMGIAGAVGGYYATKTLLGTTGRFARLGRLGGYGLAAYGVSQGINELTRDETGKGLFDSRDSDSGSQWDKDIRHEYGNRGWWGRRSSDWRYGTASVLDSLNPFTDSMSGAERRARAERLANPTKPNQMSTNDYLVAFNNSLNPQYMEVEDVYHQVQLAVLQGNALEEEKKAQQEVNSQKFLDAMQTSTEALIDAIRNVTFTK